MKTKIFFVILGLTTFFACKKSDSDSSTSTPPLHLVIGQTYQGGIVAYIDPTGQHGLIAAPADLQDPGTTTYPWWLGYDGSFKTTHASGTAVGSGKQNTAIILASMNTSIDSQAFVAVLNCQYYSNDGYRGWYLPSQNELYQLYVNRVAIGGFLNGRYWSSTEYDETQAVYINFANGEWYQKKKDTFLLVRPVRSF